MSRALLLAEAEPGTRAFLERHLASEGFEVLGADAEREALELAERARPDLVLIGALEDAAGAEVCRRLREGVPGRSWDRNGPVIVLGETQAAAVDRAQAVGRGGGGCRAARGDPARRPRPRAGVRAWLRRLRAAAVPLRGARRADPRGASPHAAALARAAKHRSEENTSA